MIRNLIYHIHPDPESNYLWNLGELLRPSRLEQFNGKIIFAVTTGGVYTGDNNRPWGRELDDVLRFRNLLPDKAIVKLVPNDPMLRETKTLPVLLNQLHTICNAGSNTFYAHTKGGAHVGSPKAAAVWAWTSAMYAKLLDDKSDIDAALEKYPVIGCFKRSGKVFKNFLPIESTWHYSGTFFWFRTRDLFSRPGWSKVPVHRYGAETYLSQIFKKEEAGCIFGNKAGDLYNPKELRKFKVLP